MKKTIFVFTFSFGQNKWTINYANQQLTNMLSKIEKSGYVIKKVALTNNGYIDYLTFDYPQSDSVFIVATAIAPTDNKIILNPSKLSLSVYGKVYSISTRREYDTLLVQTEKYDKRVDNNAKNNICTWHITILPNQFPSIRPRQYSVTLDENVTIGTIDSKDLPKGNTPEEIEKNSDHRQLFIVIYSKS